MFNPLRLPLRLRKFIGAILLVGFIVFYALLAITLGMRLMPELTPLWQALYYCAAGLIWIIPAGAIVWFMQKRSPQ